MFKTALCAVALTVLASSAMAATTVDVTFTDVDYSAYSGSFIATDTNGDGIIEEDEVTSFTTSLLGSVTLLDFGDYVISSNTWTLSDDGYYYEVRSGHHLLGLTGDDTVTTAVVTTTATVTSAVPEPAGLPMFALGALALMAVARRRKLH